MTTIVAPPSLQRTNSNGHCDIYLLIENKINADLLIIPRNILPPTLRAGKLNLKQKVTFRNQERHNIEGTIIYMSHSRENCEVAKNNILQNRKQQKENGRNKSSDHLDVSDSRILIGNASSKNVTKKSTQIQKKTKNNRSNKNSTTMSSTSLLNELYEDEDEDNDDIIHSSSIEYSFSSTEPISNQQETMDTALQNANETASTIEEIPQNEIYLQKIDELSSKVSEQKKLIKKQEDEIKRLRATTIEIPSDPAIQNFIISFAGKVRQQTTKFKYQGNFAKDAKNLGLNVQQLNTGLKTKGGITSVARELFKMIVPEHRRQVDHWNELKDDVLFKETILIDFLERYYGFVMVDKKKIHTSLVGCLRNERHIQKKQLEQSVITENQDKQSDDIQNTRETTGVEDLYSD